MGFDVTHTNGHPKHSNLKDFVCTSVDDISRLPTANTRGTQTAPLDSILNDPVAIGSTATIADGSGIYILSPDNVWVKFA